MSRYVSAKEAERLYGVPAWKLRKLEKTGELPHYDARSVGYEQRQRGPAVRRVYMRADITKALGMNNPSPNVFVGKNKEADALELLFQGKNAAEIARQTKLRLKDVQALRDAYAAETKAVLLPAHIMEELAKLGCPVQSPEDVVNAFGGLLWRLRELQRVPAPPPASSSRESEQGKLVIPAHLVDELEKMGFPMQSAEAFVAAVALLFAHVRGAA